MTISRVGPHFGYNAVGLVDRVRDPLAADLVASGRRADDDSTRWQIGYDFAARVSSVTGPAPTAAAPRPARTITYPSTAETQVQVAGAGTAIERRVQYDPAGRMTRDTDAAGLATTVEWDPAADRVLSSTDPAGLRTTSIYSPEGWATDTWGPAPASWFNAARIPAGHENEVAQFGGRL